MRTLIPFVCLSVCLISLPSCAPIVAGGIFWDHIENREQCNELMADPKFAEKMKVPEYKERFQVHCGKDEVESKESDNQPKTSS